MKNIVKNFVNQVKGFWNDDHGTGADIHSTNFLYLVGGLAITSLVIGAVGVILMNKGTGINSDISGYKVNVPASTNGATSLTNAGLANGNSTVKGITFQ